MMHASHELLCRWCAVQLLTAKQREDCETGVRPQSWRRMIIGSARIARRTGTYAATATTASRSTAFWKNVIGSAGATPTRKLFTSGAAMSEQRTPNNTSTTGKETLAQDQHTDASSRSSFLVHE